MILDIKSSEINLPAKQAGDHEGHYCRSKQRNVSVQNCPMVRIMISQYGVKTWPKNPQKDCSDDGEDVRIISRPFQVFGETAKILFSHQKRKCDSKISPESMNENGS